MTDRAVSPVVYLDTNPFIYLVEGDQAISTPMRQLFARLRQMPGVAMTSELTLAEVLAPKAAGERRPPETERTYLDLIIWSKFIGLEPVSREILLETRRLRTMARFALPDAIHVCTAILKGCELFLTQDHGINAPAGMELVRPDHQGIARLFEALQ